MVTVVKGIVVQGGFGKRFKNEERRCAPFHTCSNGKMIKNREKENGCRESPHFHAVVEGYRIARFDRKDQPGRE